MTAYSPSASLENQSTVMTMIRGALEASPDLRRQNFDRLIRYYRAPLIQYLTARYQVPLYEADDVVQTFLIKKFLEPQPQENLVSAYLKTGNAEPGKGRFRHFLKTALRHHFIDHYRKTRRNAAILGLDFVDENCALPDIASDKEFDQVWACNLIRMVIDSVREECERKKQDDIWFVFYERSLRPVETGEPAPSFEELCASGRFPSAEAASNRYETARRKIKAALRNHVIQYLPTMTAEQVTDELLSLKEILLAAATGSRNGQQLYEIETVNSILQDDEAIDATIQRLREQWKRTLEIPISRAIFELRDAPLNTQTESPCDTTVSLGEIIGSSHPSLPLLRLIKDAAKEIGAEKRKHPDGEDQVLISRVLYAVAIALAKIVHHEDISRRSGATALGRFEELLTYDWLDEVTKSVIDRWLSSFASAAHAE